MTTRPTVPTADAHIHEGEAGVAGDIVLTPEASRDRGVGHRPGDQSVPDGTVVEEVRSSGPRPSLRSELRTFWTPYASASAIRSCRVLDGVGSGTNQLFLSNGHPDGARSSGPPEGGSL
jgi:hypothetical protein